jgi:flagellar hook assembly protein FlgD
MKSLIAKLFAPALLVAALAAPAAAADGNGVEPKDKFAFSLYALNGTAKFRLAFENPAAGRVTVQVRDDRGRLVHTDHIGGQAQFKRDYDLAALGRGVYTVIINNGEFTTANRVAVGGAKLVAQPFSAYVSPGLMDGAAKVAFQGGQGVRVTVTDQNGQVVYSEYNEDQQFARRYQLGGLPKGRYTLAVASTDTVLEQEYVVK